MADITIDFSDKVVEFYHVPTSIKRAITRILEGYEKDLDVISGVSEKDKEE